MHIILVSDRLTTAKSITLTGRHLVLTVVALAVLVLSLSSAFSYLAVRNAAEWRIPFLQDLLRTINAEETQKSKEFLRENLNAMAVKLGEMQAQMTRLDSIGERLANIAGVRIQEIRATEQPAAPLPAARAPGRGGPLIQPTVLSETDLRRAMDDLSRQLEARSDTMSLLEAQMFEERVRKAMLPTTLPVAAQWNASAYGWRIDPFTGERALHEGVDFSAEVGTTIVAAAAGVVIASERHPDYGNTVEIDHGHDMTTRYAHASRLLVKAGDVVKRGQKIAEVGNTGRSTGAHLHFEVRYKGAAQNPNRFLQQAQANGLTLASRSGKVPR